VLFAKCFIRLLGNLVDGQADVLVHYQTYLVLVGLGASIFFQIRWINDGLRRFDASYTVPVFTAFWILLCAVSGLIFYHEYSGMNTTQMVLFGFGIVITVVCVVSLSRNHQQSRRRDSTYAYEPVRTEPPLDTVDAVVSAGFVANDDDDEPHPAHLEEKPTLRASSHRLRATLDALDKTGGNTSSSSSGSSSSSSGSSSSSSSGTGNSGAVPGSRFSRKKSDEPTSDPFDSLDDQA